jgi:uncharacterized protein
MTTKIRDRSGLEQGRQHHECPTRHVHAARGAWDRPHTFDIVLKLAERCNLSCRYCYYYFQQYDPHANRPLMSRRVINALPGYLQRSLHDLNICGFNFVLHGGEPLLMPKREFDYLCGLIRHELEDKTDIEIFVQTNAVLVDEEWISIFERHRVRVGVSIDGPPHLHDMHRKDHAGRGTYHATVRGLRLLQAAATQRRLPPVGAISVVPACEDSSEVLSHLVEDLEILEPNLNFPHDGWDNQSVISWSRAVDCHRSFVRYTLEKLLYPKLHFVRGVTNFLLNLKSEKGAAYNDLRVAHQHHIATISSEGGVYVDDNMLSVDPRFAKSGLSVFDGSLRDLIDSPEWQRMNEAIDMIPADCADCRWRRSCRSGYLFNRFSKDAGFSRKSALCETLKMIHEECEDFLLRNGLATETEICDLLSREPTCSAKDTYRVLTTLEEAV